MRKARWRGGEAEYGAAWGCSVPKLGDVREPTAREDDLVRPIRRGTDNSRGATATAESEWKSSVANADDSKVATARWRQRGDVSADLADLADSYTGIGRYIRRLTCQLIR